MQPEWMPSKIGSSMNFFWWEMDEVMSVLAGIILFVLKKELIWLLVGIAWSVFYMKVFKRHKIKYIWRDFFLAFGVRQMPGYPVGTSRRFAE